MISVRDLRIDYDNLCAVQDLTFSVAEGEVFGLIGPNGAGKTSTMRAMVGLLAPTYGSIEIAGINIHEEPQAVGQVLGFMPDFPPVYDDLLVWEFLDLFAASYFIPKPRRRPEIVHRLEQVGLTGKTNSLVGELSRGMRQRLMLAKTLLPEPKVLLLDEPASGLDPHGRAQMKQVIRDFASNGGAVLISSHILSEMDEFCTSIGIMQRGDMIVSGKVDEIAAKVMNQSMLRIELVSGQEAFRKIIARYRVDAEPVQTGRCYDVPFNGDDRAASELLAELVSAGVRISSFTRKRESLEDVFLQIGAKELS
ncbi:MAG: ABC transporter ATP-binding protein [Planctomycetota bacterium]|nr:ABC transporter ATP-binding protein [Planctomycetota bacterium]MDA1162664.1 ABC transporter ATP-binding protein [Planctomycetota bacterium]